MDLRLLPQLPQRQRVSIFGVCVLCLPLHDGEAGDWNAAAALKICRYLCIDDSYAEAFAPMMRMHAHGSAEDRLRNVAANVSAFLDEIGSLERKQVVIELTLRVLLAEGYGARERGVLRRLCVCFKLPWNWFATAEKVIGQTLLELSTMQHAHEKKKGGAARYAKIGVAAVGAGALLAFTGGLAAPFIAAGIAAIGTAGTASVAALATTAAVSTIFGTTGAGLASYKMNRRTIGLTEFEFNLEKGEGSLAVCICVGGWVQDNQDYKRAFGVIPSELTLEERVAWFYRLHDPEKVKDAEREAKEAIEYDAVDVFLERLRLTYEKDPMDMSSLTPPARQWPEGMTDEQRAEIFDIIMQINAKASSESKERARAGRGGGSEEQKQQSQTSPRATPSPPASSADEAVAGSATAEGDEIEDMFLSLDVSADEAAIRAEEELAKEVLEAGDFGLLSPSVEQTSSADEAESVLSTEALAQEAPAETERDRNLSLWCWEEIPGSETYEMYTVKWETDLLLELGSHIFSLLKSARDQAATAILQTTIFASLVTALAWPLALVKLADLIDGVWTLACERADEAGKVLAGILRSRAQGARPVTLIGYSVGARVIFACLEELYRLDQEDMKAQAAAAEAEAASGDGAESSSKWSLPWKKSASGGSQGGAASNAPRQSSRGLIEDVILLGAPTNVDPERWGHIRSMAAGRVVNGYSNKDLVLALVYRYERWAVRVAGTSAVKLRGVENIDLSDIVESHTDYLYRMSAILKRIGLNTNSPYKFV